jgi:tRNA pseudouridine38-40 synthase
MPRRNFLLTLAYEGGGFSGWQRLPEPERTVQREVEAALCRILEEKIEIVGAGRTDSGVHAEGQGAGFHSRTGMTCAGILAALRDTLPADIRCKACREVDPRFHARFRAKSKTYRYRLHVADGPDPRFRATSLHVDRPFDLGAVSAAAGLFEGEHDFRAFTNAPKTASTRSRIDNVRIVAMEDFVDLYFRAPGFLYNQVRIMAGTLVAVGKGTCNAKTVAALLASGERAQAPEMAGAFGLCLVDVTY